MIFKDFSKEERGDVVQYILVLAAIVVILVFAFPKIKTVIKDATEKTSCNVNTVMSETNTNENCVASNNSSGGGTTTPPDTENPGEVTKTVYRSCLETWEHEPLSPNGLYPIKLTDGTVKNMTCDMTGGGWTLMSNYDYSTNKTPPSGSNLVAKDAFTSTRYEGTAPEGWYPIFTTNSNGAMHVANFYSNAERINYTNVKFDMKVNFVWTVDSFGNTHGSAPNRMSLDGHYVDGISVTTGAEGNRNHILTATWSSTMPTDERATFLKTDVVSGATIDKVITKAVPKNNEKIETRIMLDQVWDDENIGIQRYKVWVK